MKMLSILRHAKSSWDEAALTDFERPLAPRGRKAAPLMGRHMREIGIAPDLVLCSAAVRTRETASLALQELGDPQPPVTYDINIYEATADVLMATLRGVPSEVGHVLLIGHNPGLQNLILALTGGRLQGRHAEIAEKLPTAALVLMELAIPDWQRIGRDCGTVRHFSTPRQLPTD
jgi:phosphohistidine phosphatase